MSQSRALLLAWAVFLLAGAEGRRRRNEPQRHGDTEKTAEREQSRRTCLLVSLLSSRCLRVSVVQTHLSSGPAAARAHARLLEVHHPSDQRVLFLLGEARLRRGGGLEVEGGAVPRVAGLQIRQ